MRVSRQTPSSRFRHAHAFTCSARIRRLVTCADKPPAGCESRHCALSAPDPMDAIIIVDLQKAFPVPTDIVRRIEQRMKPFRMRVFTKFINPPGSIFRRRLNRTSCTPGDPETELLLTAGPHDLVVEKASYGLGPDHLAALH